MKKDKLKYLKSTGFKSPEGYFESFEEKMFSKLNAQANLDYPIKTGFKAPKDYFESLEMDVLTKVSTQKETKVISLLNKRNLIYLSGVAAAILLIFNIGVFDPQPSFESLSIETVENYIIDENISSYEIASLLTEDIINNGLDINYNFEEENIEDYLLE